MLCLENGRNAKRKEGIQCSRRREEGQAETEKKTTFCHEGGTQDGLPCERDGAIKYQVSRGSGTLKDGQTGSGKGRIPGAVVRPETS